MLCTSSAEKFGQGPPAHICSFIKGLGNRKCKYTTLFWDRCMLSKRSCIIADQRGICHPSLHLKPEEDSHEAAPPASPLYVSLSLVQSGLPLADSHAEHCQPRRRLDNFLLQSVTWKYESSSAFVLYTILSSCRGERNTMRPCQCHPSVAGACHSSQKHDAPEVIRCVCFKESYTVLEG